MIRPQLISVFGCPWLIALSVLFFLPALTLLLAAFLLLASPFSRALCRFGVNIDGIHSRFESLRDEQRDRICGFLLARLKQNTLVAARDT